MSDRDVDDGPFAHLRQDFDDDAIIELTVLLAFQNVSSNFSSGLAASAAGFCRLPGTASDGKQAGP